MATCATLVTNIITDLGRSEASLSDVVLLDVQSAIREYEAQRFYFNEQLVNLTLSNTDTYAMSLFAAAGTGIADIIEVDNFDVIINSTRKYSLEEVSVGELIELQAGASGITGYPQYFALFNQAIKINPMANAAYVSELWAHVKFTEIAAGGFATSNVWTNDASDLIRNAALKRLWARRYRDFDAAKAAGLLESDALKALQKRSLAGSTIDGYL